MTLVRKAVFPVAGFGTRFLPATKAVPKEMLPLLDKPLIQYAVDEAIEAGIEEFIFITAPGKSAIEDYFGASPALEQHLAGKGKHAALRCVERAKLPEGHASFIRQNSPRGLGHAVWLARHAVGNEPFALLLPDDVLTGGALRQMVQAYERSPGHMLATQAVPDHRISDYGVVDIADTFGRVQTLQGLVEKPILQDAPSSFGIVGRYILDSSIFDHLDNAKPGAGGEIQLTDAIAAGLGERPVTGYAFDGQRFDCGSVAGHTHATLALALEREDLQDNILGALSALQTTTTRAA